MTESLYTKCGGSAQVATIVREFYDRIEADPSLTSYFEGVDMTSLIAHQTNFIGKALGGPEVYDGSDLGVAHAQLAIDNDAFNRVAGHLAAVLGTTEFDEADCSTILELVGSLRDQIVKSD